MQSVKELATKDLRKRPSLNEPERCWKWFTKFFPRGFHDPKYLDWERGYKAAAHEDWRATLSRESYRKLLKQERFSEIASIAVRIESRTNLLFSFEKMALRDAVRTSEGAKIFAEGLFELLHGRGGLDKKFDSWCKAVSSLPRKHTRVLTHPVVTVFPFIADPVHHMFLKPNVTKDAAKRYGFDFRYESRPSWAVYSQLLKFAGNICDDLKSESPRDMIDIQSFVWVIGSDEYRNMAI